MFRQFEATQTVEDKLCWQKNLGLDRNRENSILPINIRGIKIPSDDYGRWIKVCKFGPISHPPSSYPATLCLFVLKFQHPHLKQGLYTAKVFLWKQNPNESESVFVEAKILLDLVAIAKVLDSKFCARF